MERLVDVHASLIQVTHIYQVPAEQTRVRCFITTPNQLFFHTVTATLIQHIDHHIHVGEFQRRELTVTIFSCITAWEGIVERVTVFTHDVMDVHG